MERKGKYSEEELLLNRRVPIEKRRNSTSKKEISGKWYDRWANLNCNEFAFELFYF